MEQEFETQVLDLDKEEIIDKLRKLGAKEEPEVMQRRWVYDIEPATKESTGEWIRLRQVGQKKPILTYKNKSGSGVSDTREIELEVSDFEKMNAIMSKINISGKYYQENKRHKFVLDNIEFTLDTWPQIPTFLEIEAKSEAEVHSGLKMLGLSGKDSGHIDTVAIYEQYGLNLHSMKELKFK